MDAGPERERFVRALEEVAGEVSILLRGLDEPRRGRPATSQERRRLAERVAQVNETLSELCHGLREWFGGPCDTSAAGPDRAPAAESPVADVTRARVALDRARAELQACVDAARSHGATWRQIGDALDITAQTAHKRFDPGARRRHAAYMRQRNRQRTAGV